MNETIISYCHNVVNTFKENHFKYTVNENQAWAAAHILVDWHQRHLNLFDVTLSRNSNALAVQSVIQFWDSNFDYYTSTDIYNTFALLEKIHRPNQSVTTRQSILYHLKKLDTFGQYTSYSQGRPYAFVA